VAVSGGPDSVALLRTIIASRDPDNPLPLVVAHLNHQLRGAESDGDEAFVVDLQARLVAVGIPSLALCLHRLDVGRLAEEQGANLEALARRLRYAWLAEVARSHGIRWVATGHTANDQAETVLHRLVRGTGLQGLRGIAACRPLDSEVGLVRPLLQATREDVLAYLQTLGQPFRLDSSNACLDHTRNRIRHELLPHLAERYNPRIVTVLARLAEQAEAAAATEVAEATQLLETAERPRAGTILVFDRQRLAAAPRHLVRAAFRLLWRREGWPLSDMGYETWERLAELVFAEGVALDLPGQVHARRRDRVLQLSRTAE
jgi:tRNA(Ile)-lysidine synthase